MKRKHRKHKIKPPGLPPGSLAYTGEHKGDTPEVLRVRFNVAEAHVERLETPAGVAPGFINWFDVRGLHDVGLIEQFGQQFNIHPLALEDILNTQQRPKFEEYGSDLFVVLSAFSYDNQQNELNTEQISLYFGQGFLLTFQEVPDDNFLPVRQRLEGGAGRIRSRQSDYLAYALLDNLVDNYFHVLDAVEQEIEELETEINTHPDGATKNRIHTLKFQLLTIRKSVVPLREAISKFSRSESPVIQEGTALYLRDLYDHVIRISDIIESYRDMLNGLQELYAAELSLRMNSVMQVLTIITTIFVPLTFVVGVYGMNFDNMPELHWRYGYFYVLGFMFLLFLGFLVYFKRKRWI